MLILAEQGRVIFGVVFLHEDTAGYLNLEENPDILIDYLFAFHFYSTLVVAPELFE